MPRIAAALAVVITAAAAIGYNTARYPVVWEMAAKVGPLAQGDRTAQTGPSDATAEPEQPEPLPANDPGNDPVVASISRPHRAEEAPLSADPLPADTWEPPAGWRDRPHPDGTVTDTAIPNVEAGRSSWDTAPGTDVLSADPPVEPDRDPGAFSPPMPAGGAIETSPPEPAIDSEQPGPTDAAGDLVPVVPAGAPVGEEVAMAPPQASLPIRAAAERPRRHPSGLRRLPPVDPNAPGPQPSVEDPATAEAIPFYPTAAAGTGWAAGGDGT